jgi:hypothetical protein
MRIRAQKRGCESERGAAARMVGDVFNYATVLCTGIRLDRGEHPETPTADGFLWAQKFEFAWLVLVHVFDQRSMASADLKHPSRSQQTYVNESHTHLHGNVSGYL